MQQDENGDYFRNSECPLTGHTIDMTLVELNKWSERVWWQVFTPPSRSGIVTSVDFSPDGNRVVSGSWASHVEIWDTATGAEVSSPVGVRGLW